MKSRPPKASFVIPVYNGELYLAEAISSCLNQSERNIEVVVVDDGSTDSTKEVLAFMASKDPRVKVVTLPENKGRSNARNVGIAEAKAPVLFMLDADDIANPDRVKLTLKYLAKNREIDYVYGHYRFIDGLGNAGPAMRSAPFDADALFKTGAMFIGHSTVAFRREVADAIHYQDGEVSKLGIDDWMFQVEAYRKGVQFGNIPVILSFYRYPPKPRDEERIKEIKKEVLKAVPA